MTSKKNTIGFLVLWCGSVVADDEESGFEAAIVSAINSAESPEVRKRLIALAIQYRNDFYDTFDKDNDEKFRKQNE